mmetsp:Transcript_14079/g.30615  ORF Transcript_14079/g.30615 Transcript_14079/m.30615 type:complete len:120 (+) Transcript_14079:386-745(+)
MMIARLLISWIHCNNYIPLRATSLVLQMEYLVLALIAVQMMLHPLMRYCLRCIKWVLQRMFENADSRKGWWWKYNQIIGNDSYATYCSVSMKDELSNFRSFVAFVMVDNNTIDTYVVEH